MFDDSMSLDQEFMPIFIVGCPRSGTTLLQRLLSTHSQIAIAPETHFIRRFWQRRDGYGPLDKDENYRRLVLDIVEMPEFEEMGIAASEFYDAAFTLVPRGFATLFELLLRVYAGIRQTEHVGEKTPAHVLYMDRLLDFFPTARFIHLIRDPRAVVNSWRFVPWSSGDIVTDAYDWYLHVRAGRRFAARHPQITLELQYESLVQNPENELVRLCDFLGLTYQPEVLNYHNKESAVNVAREPWKALSATPITASRVEGWRDELTSDQTRTVEAVTLLMMKDQGYVNVTPLSRLLVPAVRYNLELSSKRVMKKIRMRLS